MRLIVLPLLLAATLPTAAWSAPHKGAREPALPRDADFDAAASRAQRVDALEPFLARFVGHCTDVYERRTCEANVAAARLEAAGRPFVVRIPDATALIRLERKAGGYLLLLTPFLDGGGLALTHGTPARQDAEGHPVVNLVPISASVPPGTMDMEFEGPFRTGGIELQIVFRPERAWKLARSGEKGSYEGVAARFVAVEVVDSRTGKRIAEKVL
jgi:hypothetical protein